MALVANAKLSDFIQNNFVRLCWTAVKAVYILKKSIKIGEFLCSHFNIEGGRKYATFLAYYVLLFQKR